MYSGSLLFGLLVTLATYEASDNSSSIENPKCKYISKDSKFKFHPLSAIPNSQPEGFFAKVKVAVLSDYGYVHILLSESDDETGKNRGYEFALSPNPFRESEIRQRNTVYGKFKVVATANYTVREYSPDLSAVEISLSTDGVVEWTDLKSDLHFAFKLEDPITFPINFIAFSGHSELGSQCDYGVFYGGTGEFIQARCETVYGWHDESFHPISSVSSSQPMGYHAKLKIHMISDYGDLHIFLAETEQKEGQNPCYEIVIGDRFSTESSIRRKDSIHEEYDFVGQTTFPYKSKHHRAGEHMEVSVSVDGVVSFVDIHKKLQFNLTDTQTAIPVKYIKFGGYINYPAIYQIDCMKTKTNCDELSDQFYRFKF